MSELNMTFGEFIVAKRRELNMPAVRLAEALGISAVYMCDIEKDRKSSVSKEFLDTLTAILKFSEAEAELMYDLAALAQNGISADLPEYIMEHKVVRTALRTAQKKDIPDEKWSKFISNLKRDEDD